MSEWRPIETAPRSGDFLVVLGNGYVTRGRYISSRFFATDSNGPSDKDHADTEPTHWQPLPAPPNG